MTAAGLSPERAAPTLRILVISPDYPPPFVGGSLAWIYELVENCDHHCHVVAAPQADPVPEPGRQPVRRSRWLADSHNPGALRLAIGYAHQAACLLAAGLTRRYDLVVANPGVVGNVVLFFIGRLVRLPVVGTAYSEEITLVVYGRGMKARFKLALMRMAYRSATGFIAVCDAARDLLGDLGVATETVAVIPPGFSGAKLPTVTSVRSAPPGRRVLSVGRLIARKGFEDSIAVIDRLRNELPDVHLTIVGEGPMRPRLEAMIARLGLERHVTLAGRAPDNELAALYRASDLFILANRMLPNGDVEGCPVVFAEAAAYGLAVVGGTAGGASSLVEDGRTGLLVPADDLDALTAAVRRLLSDPVLSGQMGQAGRERIATAHAPETIGRQFSEALSRLART